MSVNSKLIYFTFSSDTRWMLGCNRNELVLFDLETRTIDKHKPGCVGGAISACGRYVYAAMSSGVIEVYERIGWDP